MNLKKILSPKLISVGLQAKSKKAVIEELLDILVANNRIPNKSAALQCLLEREDKMSTGIQFGIAIPHGKTDTIKELVACIGIHKDGVDFNALDKELSHIFIMTISPSDRTGPHIQFLAEVSTLLKDPDSREKIQNAASAEDVYSIFCR